MKERSDRQTDTGSPVGLGTGGIEMGQPICGVNEDVEWPDVALFENDELKRLTELAEDPVMPDWLFAEAEEATPSNKAQVVCNVGEELGPPAHAENEKMRETRFFLQVSNELWRAEQEAAKAAAVGRSPRQDSPGRKANTRPDARLGPSNTSTTTALDRRPQMALVDRFDDDRTGSHFFQYVAMQFYLDDRDRASAEARTGRDRHTGAQRQRRAMPVFGG
ncbi:hypothetical protein CSUB01_08518 [Colletotrichum sublineola]|uniref:Uncharacterized protein n=1 Tax=Colletotrichum sublineola TaxID=1173701 RepID=A0A066X1B2_COLSU|nr:hypothetical protein CSUB01_08518 [Colletotrichum sublineola]